MLTTYVEPFSPEHTSVSGMEKCIFTPTHTEPAVRRQPGMEEKTPVCPLKVYCSECLVTKRRRRRRRLLLGSSTG